MLSVKGSPVGVMTAAAMTIRTMACLRYFRKNDLFTNPSKPHAEYQHHKIVDVRVQGDLILYFCAELIGREKTKGERIDHEIT